MRLLVFVGSPRVQGNTYRLLEYLIKVLKLNKIKYSIVKCKSTIMPCQHCGKCTSGYCVINDSWYSIIKNFKHYDGVIFMSPIYFFHFTAQTKAFIDRLGGAGSKGWNNKILSCILTSGSKGYLGGKSLVVSSLKRTAKYHRCVYAGCYNKITYDMITEVSNYDKSKINLLVKKIMRCYNEVIKEK